MNRHQSTNEHVLPVSTSNRWADQVNSEQKRILVNLFYALNHRSIDQIINNGI